MYTDMKWPRGLKEAVPRKQLIEEMGCGYMAEGLITIGGSRLYTMMAHTDDVIDDAIARFDRVFSNATGAVK